jgi:hypothetical protein
MHEPDKAHIEELRRWEAAGLSLTETERAELDNFYRKVEEYEAAYLTAATEHLRRQRFSEMERLRQLEALRDRKRDAVMRLEGIVREFERLQAEEDRLLAAVRG